MKVQPDTLNVTVASVRLRLGTLASVRFVLLMTQIIYTLVSVRLKLSTLASVRNILPTPATVRLILPTLASVRLIHVFLHLHLSDSDYLHYICHWQLSDAYFLHWNLLDSDYLLYNCQTQIAYFGNCPTHISYTGICQNIYTTFAYNVDLDCLEIACCQDTWHCNSLRF